MIGQRVPRREDHRLLTGQGCFVDDVAVPGALHVAFVRSPHARARLTGLDTGAARALPGVHAVLTAAEVNAALQGEMLPTPFIAGGQSPSAPVRPLADGDVRYAGEPVAVVVARSRAVAEDAAELVEVGYEPMPAIVDPVAARSTDERVHPNTASNEALVMTSRSRADKAVEERLAASATCVRETFVHHRQTPLPLEPRGIVAWWRPAQGELDVWLSSQNAHEARRCCARVLGVAESRVRVVQGDVGGAFGLKYFVHREEVVVILAARLLGRPLKWIEDRRENLLASHHARADQATVTIGVDGDGRVTAARIDHVEDVGAFPIGGSGGAGTLVVHLFPGPYRVPKLAWSTAAVWTNTCGRGAYRGPWMMETVAREQSLDVLARAAGIDPLELRRRNVITAAELPFRSSGMLVLDHVTPAETLEQAAALIGYDTFRRRQAGDRARGVHRGIGIALHVEPQTGAGPTGVEPATVRVEPDGTVTALTGSGAHGQGLETTVAQVVAAELGVPFGSVVVRQGDTAVAPFGGGTGGSRSAPVMTPAVHLAAQRLRAKVLAIASSLLEVPAEDLTLESGRVGRAGGATEASVPLASVARAAYERPADLPAGHEPGLEATVRFKAPTMMYSNACHMCTCVVDVGTGEVRLERYVVSEDCGVMINPQIVEGQIIGGVAQGIGAALHERFTYGPDGTPATTTLGDYGMAVAAEIPPIEIGHVETPGPNPGGHKGMGEGGAIASPAAVFNAVADALAPLGVRLHGTPLDPPTVLAAIEAAAR